MKKHLTLLFGLLSFTYLTGCQQPASDSTTTPADYCSSSGLALADEIAECLTSSTYSSPVSVTGTATFYKRGIDVSPASGTITSLTLGAPISAPLPIKYAEVRVLNSSGTVVQCGRTDASGDVKALDGTSTLSIPNTADTYTVQILARTQHDYASSGGKPAFKFYTAVKNVCTNTVHSISSTVVSSGSGSYSISPIAYARESESTTVAGGAFNIFNDLGAVYDYLSANTGTSNLACVSNKLSVFWTAGFNPAQFVYPTYDPVALSNISFYLRGYNELYINGGKLGNVTSADTDQFDDSVIIHELGHYLEDACGEMESPGGSHYGQFRIDPRLAWSEGWGNFVGAHMVRNNLSSINPDLVTDLASRDGWLYYLDTAGYSDGSVSSAGELIRFNLSKPGTNPDIGDNGLYYDRVSPTSYPGEGHFREVSVARSLFKSTNTCTSGYCTNQNYFAKMWEAFENDISKSGMGKAIYPFRSSIRYFDRLQAVSVSGTLPSSISTMLNTDEAQQLPGNSAYVTSGTTTWVPYGTKLVSTGSSPCSLAIQPRNEDIYVTYQEPDQRYSNHFYYFDRNTAPSVTDIYMSVTKTGGTTTDIDLILYANDYNFVTETCTSVDSNDICQSYTKNLTSTEYVKADRSTGNSTPKHIMGLGSLSFAVPYLLNVRAYTTDVTISPSTQYTYVLTDQNGGYLCPSPTY